jgi:hypothetical protein
MNFLRVKCTSGPQTCVVVSSRSTNSKSVSLRSLIAVRISLQVQTGLKTVIIAYMVASLDSIDVARAAKSTTICRPHHPIPSSPHRLIPFSLLCLAPSCTPPPPVTVVRAADRRGAGREGRRVREAAVPLGKV